jgi:hypothetical protein
MRHSGDQIAHSYRFYFLDDGGGIAAAHDIELASDDEASTLAAQMLTEQSRHPAIEVWERKRQVCRHPAFCTIADRPLAE